MKRPIDRIDEAMERLGVKQKDLARKVRLRESRFSAWRGSDKTPPRGEPTVGQWQKIAQALGMTSSELLGEVPPPAAGGEAWRRELYEAVGRLAAAARRLDEAAVALEATARAEAEAPASVAVSEPKPRLRRKA